MNPRPDQGKVRELFHAVVDLPPDERRRYLDAHCPDAELRRRVDRLLAADASLQREPPPDPAALLAPTQPASPGTRETGNNPDFPTLPGYEILAKVGQGG